MVERDDELLVVPRQVADDAPALAQRKAARVGLAIEPEDAVAAGDPARRRQRAAPGGGGRRCPPAARRRDDRPRAPPPTARGIAISNHRLHGLDGDHVVFTWRDRAHGDRQRTMRLPAHEFLRRFLLHVLPDGFVRIRSYGLLANRNRHERIARCREALGAPPGDPPPPVVETGWAELYARLTGTDPTRCPRCGTGHLLLIAEIPAAGRGPPPARRTP